MSVALEKARKKSARFITAIDPVELACRLIEASNKMKRPPGVTAAQAFFAFDQEDQNRWLAAANAAMEYWRECIKDLSETN